MAAYQREPGSIAPNFASKRFLTWKPTQKPSKITRKTKVNMPMVEMSCISGTRTKLRPKKTSKTTQDKHADNQPLNETQTSNHVITDVHALRALNASW